MISLICLFPLIGFSGLFWSSDKADIINLFANDYADLNFIGFEIPAVWFNLERPVYYYSCASIWLVMANDGA